MAKREENLFLKNKEKKPEKKRKKFLPERSFFKGAAGVFFCAAALAFAFCFALPRAGYSERKFGGAENYKCIVELWHIDSFEGGVGSRAEFLLKRAAEFEKTRAGVFVMVTPMTAETASERMAAGEYPDAVSYGYGVEVRNFSPIATEKKSPFGTLDGKVYAVPWCRGGYAILSRGELPQDKILKNAVVSKGEYTQPYAALAESGFVLENAAEKAPLDAYYRFVGGMADILVGTQRDVNRLNARGKTVCITPLAGYNDLHQYFSVTAESSEKKYYAETFIDYVLSDSVQRKLPSIGMLSPYIAPAYGAEGLNAMQAEMDFKGISVFTPAAVYEEFSENARRAAEGDADALKKIKNLLV